MNDMFEKMMNHKIESKIIDSPFNDKYKKLCLESGEEIKKIMHGYALAAHEASKILVD